MWKDYAHARYLHNDWPKTSHKMPGNFLSLQNVVALSAIVLIIDLDQRDNSRYVVHKQRWDP